jgi:rhamnulokinase
VIHIIGGGSRNRLMNTLTANATGKPVIAGPVEATAAGNLMVQAMGMGLVSSLENIRQVVSNSFSLEVFEPLQTTGWDDALARYQKICQ